MVDAVDCVVIGAGVIGLAIARRFAQHDMDTLVLEAAEDIGTGVSSRSSEVVHAGIHYPAGSLKARLCRTGRILMDRYCRERNVGYRQCGKLIVASSEHDRAGLARVVETARANGVTDLVWLTREEARAREPALECRFALRSPSTGIVDSRALMLSLQADMEAAGGVAVLRTPVTGGDCRRRGRIRLSVGRDAELEARFVINCGGLRAQAIAASLQGFDPRLIPRLFLAKGSYYVLRARCPFSQLIYPVPEAAGLGTHLTLDLAGQARFGPDVEWVETADYSVDPHRAQSFYAAIRTYWPALPDGALAPGYAGIRPKLQSPGAPSADFVIQGPQEHGIPGLVNLFGIESPGLTCALSIAEYVVALSLLP